MEAITAEDFGRKDCQYSLRQCRIPALKGYSFCRTHILEDKSCPFNQCSYVSGKTGRRCAQATLKPSKKEGLCPQHSTKLNRSRCAIAKKQLASNSDTAESLLSDLECYSTTLYNNSRQKQKVNHNDNANSYLAEFASSSDSDMEPTGNLTGSCWQPDSDSESVDSEQDDIFKYAEVLTAEEATRITRDKLIRLQSLYIEQFKWLQNVLKERRRKYLLSKSAETVNKNSDVEVDMNAEEATVAKENNVLYKDMDIVKQYVASRRYHRRHGQEALMYMRSQERRRAICDPLATDGHMYNRYRYSSKHGTKYCSHKSSRCHEKSLPFTRYCFKHMDFDSHQVLFRRCGFQAVEEGLHCERIVASISNYNRCDYHTNVDDLNLVYPQHHIPYDESSEGKDKVSQSPLLTNFEGAVVKNNVYDDAFMHSVEETANTIDIIGQGQ